MLFFLHVDLFFFGFMRCNPKLRDWPNLHMRIHATWVFDLVQFSVFSGCAFFVLHYTRLKLLGVKISGRELFFLICLFPLWNARLGQFTCEIIKTGNDFPDFVVFVGHFIFGVKISGWEFFFLDLGIIYSHSSCSNLKCEIGIIYIWDFRDWKWFPRLCCFCRAFYFG